MLLLSFSSNGGYHNTRVTGKRLIYLKLKPVRYIGVYKGKGRGKGKGHPITGHESPEVEERYSSTLSLTSELNGVGGQRHDPAALPPAKTQYPLYGIYIYIYFFYYYNQFWIRLLPCLISPSNFGCIILNFPSQHLVIFNSVGSRIPEFACNLLTPQLLLCYSDIYSCFSWTRMQCQNESSTRDRWSCWCR